MARLYDDITETVGNTPLARLNRTAGALADICFNPRASVKDRRDRGEVTRKHDG